MHPKVFQAKYALLFFMYLNMLRIHVNRNTQKFIITEIETNTVVKS